MEPTENEEQPTPIPEPQVILTSEAQYYLYESGKWARFLGVMGFIGAGFLLLVRFFLGSIMSMIFQYRQPSYMYSPHFNPMMHPHPMIQPYSMMHPYPMMGQHALLGWLIWLIYIGLAIVYFFISLKLYRFGTGIKQAIEFKDTLQVSSAFNELHAFFKLKGIVLICTVAIYTLLIICIIIAFAVVSKNSIY